MKRTDLAQLPVGQIQLDHGARAYIQHYETSPADELDFETHENFFDIQYVVAGEEYVGVATRVGLKEKVPYSPERDTTLYFDPELYGYVYLRAGDYAVLAPEDVHKPRCCVNAPAPVIKVVVKVPV